MRLGGSVDTGRTISDNCFIVDSPMQLKYNAGIQNRRILSGNAPVLGVGTVSSVNPTSCQEGDPCPKQPGYSSERNVSLAVRLRGERQLQQRAGRPGSGGLECAEQRDCADPRPQPVELRHESVCTATFTVPLVQPGTLYEARRTQLDLRFNKTVRLTRRAQLTGNLGIYNVLNANNVLSINQTYGPNWLKPVRVMDGRLFQIAARLDF